MQTRSNSVAREKPRDVNVHEAGGRAQKDDVVGEARAASQASPPVFVHCTRCRCRGSLPPRVEKNPTRV